MKLIIANWKMNPETPQEARALAKASDAKGLVIAPPFLFLEDAAGAVTHAQLGSQDVFWEDYGAYTGEISAKELVSIGVRYAIVGHSERRRIGETDAMVAKKMVSAMRAGITPILCVGESREEHDAGRAQEVVRRELELGLSLVVAPSYAHSQMSFVVAYEPIWAIGSGTPDTPESSANMVLYIRKVVQDLGIDYPIRVIYGGSVNAGNAKSFLDKPEIDGALVGGASLKPEEIKKIVAIASTY